ncbi:MAG TPA: phospho-N-acetylmuramoyl-pentapeptide-transferase [Candidatus Dormibacteraeota bacterium]|nr:phospho-N-acetylmuramoyl-pentapeptide-transferase [Candidatus Dormibacteraeota bacterium]
MNTLHIAITSHELIRILSLSFFGFALSMLITPLYTTIAYKQQWWKRQRTDAWSGGKATVYAKLHAEKHKRHIPTMAGIIFVLAITIVTLIANLNRGQTWLPLAGLVGAAGIGLIDDFMNIRSIGGVAGMSARVKFSLYSILVLAAGWWFYAKNGVHSIYLPWIAHNQWHVGIFIIALFWLVVMATAISVNFSDGLDGLAGGLLTSSFMAYSIIAIVESKFILAGFCLTIVGALLSYTWFNIYPARFFMGDVGAFALGTALGIIALQTNTMYVLPIIGAVYVMETGSVIINRTSRKLRNGKKVFLSSPIHHHFEAIGWPETKVTMRFWILGQIASAVGLIIFLMGRRG